MSRKYMKPGGSRAALRKRKRKAGQVIEKTLVKNDSNSEQDNKEDDFEIAENESEDLFTNNTVKLVEDEAALNLHVESKTVIEIINLSENAEHDPSLTVNTKAFALMSKLLHPTTRNSFYLEYYEKQPLQTMRVDQSYFNGIINRKEFFKIFETEFISIDVDVTIRMFGSSSSDQLPSTINLPIVKDCIKNSYTVQLLNPQKYHDCLWEFISILEYEFNSLTIANVVLCPPNSTNSELHYENTDIFVLQVEGMNQVTIYKPLDGRVLPTSSHSYESLEALELEYSSSKTECRPYLQTELHAGDTLYVPKGWTFQMKNKTNNESLLLLLSVNHSNTVADFIELVLPQALTETTSQISTLRKSIPRNYASFLGITNSEKEESIQRRAFQREIQLCFRKVMESALVMIDPAADQFKKRWIAQRLPVPSTDYTNDGKEVVTYSDAPEAIIFPYTKLRMLRPDLAIAIIEDGKVVVYHSMDNARELYGAPLQPLEFELDDGPTIEALLLAYPHGVTVSDLPHPSEELDDKVGVAQALYKESFLVIVDEVSKPKIKVSKKRKEKKVQKQENLMVSNTTKIFNAKKNKKKTSEIESDEDPF